MTSHCRHSSGTQRMLYVSVGPHLIASYTPLTTQRHAGTLEPWLHAGTLATCWNPGYMLEPWLSAGTLATGVVRGDVERSGMVRGDGEERDGERGW